MTRLPNMTARFSLLGDTVGDMVERAGWTTLGEQYLAAVRRGGLAQGLRRGAAAWSDLGTRYLRSRRRGDHWEYNKHNNADYERYKEPCINVVF